MTLKSVFHYLNLRSTRLFPRLNPLTKFILIFTLIIGSIFLTKNIFAQQPGVGDFTTSVDKAAFIQTYLDKQNAIESGNNQEAWIHESILSNAVSLNGAIIGEVTEENLASGNWAPGGLLGLTNNSIAALYQPPISGVQYIAHTIDNLISKPTYAANGFGFDQLSNANGIMTLWRTTRNATYSLISLFFIIIGIMIMLRIKISPQATISIQAIIPKAITTLILITFSYAIVGLLIDFSYVIQGIILSLIDKNNNIETVTGGYTLQHMMELNWTGVQMIISKQFFTPIAQGVLRGFTILAAAAVGFFTGGGLFNKAASALSGGIIGFFIIDIIIFIYMAKLFFGLAKCYLTILLKIVTAPLEIALGVFPQSKTNFSSWITQLIANLLVFPATSIYLVIVTIFVKAVAGDNAYFWSPNILANGQIVGFIIGFTGIILLSKIPQIVPEFLFNIKPSPMNKMMSDSIAAFPGMKTLRGGIERAAEYAVADKTKKAAEKVKEKYDEWRSTKIISRLPTSKTPGADFQKLAPKNDKSQKKEDTGSLY